jgi:antitoxin FitA
MGQLTVRGVDDDLIHRLKMRAAENGRSAEAEHREILKDVLGATGSKDWWADAREFRERLRRKYGALPDSGKEISDMRAERTEYLAERHAAAEPRRR